MPYSHITRTAFGADAIAYARGDGKGHNDNEVRNEYIGCVNMLPDNVVPFEKQMQPFWDRADSRHTTQTNRFIVSFAVSELDPEKPEDGMKGLAILEEIARRNAPDNQSAIFMQRDGKGRKWHGHIITNDVNMSDFKGIDSKAYAHFHFQKIVDEVCQQYFDLAQPEAQPEKVNPSVRGSRMKNEQIRAANEKERQQAAKEGREVDPDKIKAERYIWQDDLRERVKEAATEATDEADFAHRLRLSGVELVPHKSKDGTTSYLHPATKKQPAHYTYELTDISGFTGKIPPNLKSKSHKLGTNYQPETIAKMFSTATPPVKNAQQEETPPVVLETPMPAPKPTRKPATKPTATKEQQSEDKEMEEAKKQAAFHISIIMRQTYGWQDPMKKIGQDGKEHIDFEEWDRQNNARDDTFEQFTRWRVDRRKELAKDGLKLPPIYIKDKDTGHVSVLRDDLETQFKDFLNRRDHPEKYAVQQQPKTQSPREALKEQPQQAPKIPRQQPQKQTAPAKPSQAEQERQKVEAQRSTLWEEVIRINTANERRWREQEQQEKQEEEYGKS